MTWKSYAIVSGATALATWLASSAPSNGPVDGAAAQGPPAASVSAAASAIEEETTRLRARLRPDGVYREPERNPFRFAARDEIAGTPHGPPAPPPVPEPQAFAPPPPPLSLAGIAEERMGERVVRTAVLSSPDGVLLVREGDVVLGHYRVANVGGAAVELVTLAGGSAVILSLTP